MFEDKNGALTPIHELGEFKLIEHLTRDFHSKQENVLRGVGDDAAVYRVGNGKVQVVSTDLLVEGVHFDLSYVPLQHLGYKSVVVNLSDIFAMNARPFGITVSIAMSSRFTVEAMEAFYLGVKKACEKYGVDLLGGDMSSSRSGLVISVSALGEANEDDVVYRNGARINDLICLTGDVGAAYAGLQVLEREKSVFLKNPGVQPELEKYNYVVGRQLKPEARGDVIDALKEAGIKPTAMIDVSDGVASEVMHICRQSGLGAQLFQDKIILDHETVKVAEEFNLPSLTMGLNGGEDYELLFTIRLDDFDKIQSFRDVHVIGHITDKGAGVGMVMDDGSLATLEAQGWKHFND